jgi:hypothetical protein
LRIRDIELLLNEELGAHVRRTRQSDERLQQTVDDSDGPFLPQRPVDRVARLASGDSLKRGERNVVSAVVVSRSEIVLLLLGHVLGSVGRR